MFEEIDSLQERFDKCKTDGDQTYVIIKKLNISKAVYKELLSNVWSSDKELLQRFNSCMENHDTRRIIRQKLKITRLQYELLLKNWFAKKLALMDINQKAIDNNIEQLKKMWTEIEHAILDIHSTPKGTEQRLFLTLKLEYLTEAYAKKSIFKEQ
jgi:hypothetical protein